MEKLRFLMDFLVHSLILVSLVMAAEANIETDRCALLALKDRITHDPNNLVANWSTTTSVCNWIGVTCGARHQRVMALNMSYFGLTGTIPPQLGNLSFLTLLDITSNSFHGSLPDELARLYRLKIINFTSNNFNIEIPSWLASLPQLQHLILNQNTFKGTIPAFLGNISSLQELRLMDNQLSGGVPKELGNLARLQILSLGKNSLGGSIPSPIFNLSSLIAMDLAENNLTGILSDNMCQNLPALQGLYMSYNHFTGQIPNNLSQCRHLRFVSLSFNQFGGRIPRDIGNLTFVVALAIGYNNLTGEIPSEIGNLQNLQLLRIQNSNLGGIIPSSIFNISALRELALANNKLSGGIPSSIDIGLPNLEGLYLPNNKLSGTIPRSISNLSNLVTLELGSNLFSGSIPPEIGSLPNLVHLVLPNNSLTGTIPSTIFNMSTLKSIALYMNSLTGQLPSSIGLSLPNLEILYLWDNQLDGPIPHSLSNASKLTVLELNSNSFSGPIPNSLGNLGNLEELFLAYNQLTRESSTEELTFLRSLTNGNRLKKIILDGNPLNGTIPWPLYVANFSALQMFEAVNCKIKGRIPPEIGRLSNLTKLHLRDNELIGPIPSTVGKMRTLQVLGLQGNRLQGFIPKEVCDLRNLGELYLSYNKLNGSIPTCLGNVASLRVLHLDSNNFTSVIPSSLWSLTDILDINLSTNSLSGHLPPGVESLRAVSQIDLSGNKLSGEIPGGIGSLQTLIVINISQNTLQGHILESFGNLINLEFLDLSSNYLQGVIPKSLEKLQYLKFINLSFNRLHGEIPTGGRFENFSAESFLGNSELCGTPRLQVPPCKTPRPSKKGWFLRLMYILLPTVLTISVLGLIVFWFRSRKKKSITSDEENVLSQPKWRRISYRELQYATNGFHESNLLGKGGFGTVYRGKLSDGMDIAIKVFNLQSERALKSFNVECEMIRKLRHRNLVKIISSCSNLDFRALVLEYMPNGSLETWLHSQVYYLNLLQRLNIMIDIASALEYLHHGNGTTIVHCDLKPSNVLLDEGMIAHVGDFGIAKLLGEEDSMTQTLTLATIGYMAPEHGSEGIVSTRGDVYSFGILMMETFTRKRPTDNMLEEGMSLKSWVEEALPHAVTQVADADLLGDDQETFDYKKDFILSILELAVDCSMDLPERRISITDALAALKNIRAKVQKCYN